MTRKVSVFGAVAPVSLFISQSAHAHVGHLGELAGHSHWIGLGAIVVAGTIAAVLGSAKPEEDKQETEEDETELAEETAWAGTSKETE